MHNPSTTTCPRCGASKIGGQIYGLCARCLGALNFTSDTSPADADAGGGMEFSRDDLVASFPQLEILEPLGRGGMGIVYKARQKELGRLVALKLLPPDRVADPQFAERFRREAQALASLAHPNIVAIYDFGQTNGMFYLLMEYVDGVNLRQAMNAGRFTAEQALAIVPPVCEALQFAHDHGVVHRDIKPENLLLDKRGHVKIADFGIAKMLGQYAANCDVMESQPAGTPQYMAPEQRQPGHSDHRADIYSLGVVLYEMLTGELPTGPLQPPSRRIQVDVHIDEIVLRALESSPEMRFSTAAEFQTSIEAVTRKEPKPLDPATISHPYGSTADHGADAGIWRVAIGGLLALFGVALLLAAPVINELVDDFHLTQTARDYHQQRARATQRWSDVRTAAAEAAVALNAARQNEITDEIIRLTKKSQVLRDQAAQAEAAVNALALRKEAIERERIGLFYLLAGALIATGLLACFSNVRPKRRPVMDRDISPPFIGTATLMSPAELASTWNQCFCYRTRGSLVLDAKRLTHSYQGRTTIIPLDAVRDVSIGRLPRLMNLAGLDVLSITYEDDGETRQVLVSPIEGWLQLSQQAVTDWFAAIRNAVVAATGRKPSTTPPEQLGIPQSSRLISALLVVVAVLVLLALYLRFANEAQQAATPAASVGVSGSFPNSGRLSTVTPAT